MDPNQYKNEMMINTHISKGGQNIEMGEISGRNDQFTTPMP